MAEKRYRNYATVIYPESMPENALDIIKSWKVPCFVSPLHDQDQNPTGEDKKPHYHVLIMFEGVKTFDQVKELFDQIGGVGVEVVSSLRGYARYLCHLDNPEKAQYKTDDVLQCSGADYFSICNLPTDRYRVIGDMITYIVSNHVQYFGDFMLWCMENEPSWYRSLCDNSSYVIKEFIKSYSYAVKQEGKRVL